MNSRSPVLIALAAAAISGGIVGVAIMAVVTLIMVAGF
jgi:hypothetical protein